MYRPARLTTLLLVALISAAAFGGRAPFRQAAATARQFTPAKLAGEYYQGEHLTGNNLLTLTANGTFDWREVGCLGVYDKCRGTFDLQDGLVVLSPAKGRDFSAHGTKFVPVAWDARLYLIAPHKLSAFRAAILGGREPRVWQQGEFYLRTPDHEQPVASPPVAPGNWMEQLDGLARRLIAAKVTHTDMETPIEGFSVSEHLVELDVGTRDGLRDGMILTLESKGPADGSSHTLLQIFQAAEDSATARIIYESQGSADRPVKAGDRACILIWADVPGSGAKAAVSGRPG